MLASALERDFGALVALFNDLTVLRDDRELGSIRANAERGLELARKLISSLDQNDGEPSVKRPLSTHCGN